MTDWNMIGIIAAFIIYFGVMIYIGFFYMKSTKTANDYILGNRSLDRRVAALSAEASDMSGWLLLGLPGLAYVSGLSEAGWTAIGLAIGTYLNWRFIAKRLRVYTEKANDSITICEFFKNRFGDKKAYTSAISSVFIIIFFVVYTAAQFVAGGKLFNSIFGLDYFTGMIICVFIIVAYTLTGGFRAVCLTDTIQGMLMFFALLIVPLIALAMLMSDGSATIAAINPDMLSLFKDPGTGEFISVFLVVSGLAWGFGYFGQPHIIPRFMGIQNPEEIPQARRIAMVWVIVTLASAIFIGLLGNIFFSTPLEVPETVFVQMTTSTLFSFIAGIVYCGILGAIMSTASSQMLVASSAISQDLYKTFFNKNASETLLLVISRITVIIVAALAVTISLDPNSSVFGIVSVAWAGFGATFGSVLLLGLFWRKATWQGALAGIVFGGVVVIGWYLIHPIIFGGYLYEMVPGVIASMLAIYLVSLKTTPDKEVTDLFDAYVAEIGDRST